MIETARLLLRPMVIEDTEAFLRIFADPTVMAAFEAAPSDRRQMAGRVQKNLVRQERYGYGLRSVLYKANGELIGNCGLTQMAIGNATVVELGYDFRNDCWNHGLATEAATAMRDYAFQVLRLPRLVGLIRRGNRASQRVAEKIGLTQAEELTRHGHDYWLYARSHVAALPRARVVDSAPTQAGHHPSPRNPPLS